MTHDEYHPDLRHEQDDQANVQLHSELNERTERALIAVGSGKSVDPEDFIALCYAAGFSHWAIRKQMERSRMT